jgi:predicted nuclease of predicted toxin-antitoxin system
MNFIVDAQLPPGLARWLTEKGYSASHVGDILLADADDTDIWDYALDHNSIIITKDEDFAERVSRSEVAPTIIWLRIGNATNRVLLKWIELRWTAVVALLDAKNRLIEVQ